MEKTQRFDYYYGIEAEQFSFYRIPKLLITDERFKMLSSDAILLYGLMLDRMALSMKNGWFDDLNRAYIIYTVENIREDLGGRSGRCSKEKAVKILAELDSKKGFGLVERIHRGLGKPDIIYVKNIFTLEDAEKEPANADVTTEVGKTDLKRSEKPTSGGRKNRLQEVGKTDFKRSENQTSAGQENRPQEVGYSDSNYKYKSNTDFSNINHIIQSDNSVEQGKSMNDPIDVMDEPKAYMELVQKNIDYVRKQIVLEGNEKEIYREMYELICEIVCVKQEKVRINGTDYPYNLVKSRFLQLNSGHLEYVISCLNKTTTKITNIRAYLLTALFNAPATMVNSINQEVQHDMFGGGWEEKGIE